MTKKIIIVCCCILGSLLAEAQKALTLSVSQAVRLGLMRNFEIEIAELQPLVFDFDRKMAIAKRRPSLNLQLRQRNRINFDNSPTSFVDGTYGSADLSASLDGRWILLDGFELRMRKKRIDQLQKQSSGRAQLVLENAINAIMLAYYNALIEKEKLKVRKAVKELSRETKSNAQTREAYGDISEYELLTTQNAYLSDSISWQTQRIQYREALLQLKATLGLSPKREVILIEQLYVQSNRLEKYAQLEKRLVSDNQDIRNQYTNLALTEANRNLERTKGRARLSASSGLSQDFGASKFSDEALDRSSVFDFYVNFTLSWTLYDGGELKESLQKLAIEEKIAQLEIDALQQKLSDELYIAYQNYTAYQDIAGIHKPLLKNLEKSLAIGKDRLEGGYSTPIEYRALQLDYLKAQLERLEVLFKAKVEEVNITRLTGGLLKNVRGGAERF